jgi:hypothetical protein
MLIAGSFGTGTRCHVIERLLLTPGQLSARVGFDTSFLPGKRATDDGDVIAMGAKRSFFCQEAFGKGGTRSRASSVEKRKIYGLVVNTFDVFLVSERVATLQNPLFRGAHLRETVGSKRPFLRAVITEKYGQPLARVCRVQSAPLPSPSSVRAAAAISSMRKTH